MTSNIRRRCTANVSRFLTSIQQEQSTLNAENAAVPQTFYMSKEAAEEMFSGQDFEDELFVDLMDTAGVGEGGGQGEVDEAEENR